MTTETNPPANVCTYRCEAWPECVCSSAAQLLDSMAKPAPDRAAQVAEVMRLAKLHGVTCRGDGIELAQAGDTVLTAKKCADSLAAIESAVKRLAGIA